MDDPFQGYAYTGYYSGNQGPLEYPNSAPPHLNYHGFSPSMVPAPATLAPTSSLSSPNEISFAGLNDVLRSPHDTPWAPGQPQHQPQLGTFNLSGRSSKAHTVAGQYPAPFQRPAFPQRGSFQSTNDSAYHSFQGGSQRPEFGTPTFQLDEDGDTDIQSTIRPPASVRSAPTTSRRTRSKAHETRCDIWDGRKRCVKVLKNNSDREKHRLQHTRPYRCDVPGCPRVLGFATANDVERHRKSVHGAVPRVGKPSGYICRACNDSTKWWPRLDNFKAHIVRKHKDYDASHLAQISEMRGPPGVRSESGYGSQMPYDQHPEESLSPHTPQMSRHRSYEGGNAVPGFDSSPTNPLAGVGMGPMADAAGQNGSYGNQYEGCDLDSAEPLAFPQSGLSVRIPEYPSTAHLSLHHPFSTIQQAFNNDLALAGSQQQNRQGSFGHQHIDLPMPYNGQDIGQPLAKRSFACEKCPKVKDRECDLRKHMKRHTRPYGCTFAACDRRLGSRNDWKRHESSQHALTDKWYCKECRYLTESEETFATHLEQRHGIQRNTADSLHISKCGHLGKDAHYHFWCGFCKTLVQQDDPSMQHGVKSEITAFEIRLSHIGDHYDKDKYSIDDWQRMTTPRRQTTLPERPVRSTGRSRQRKQPIQDDISELGDDGIPGFARDTDTYDQSVRVDTNNEMMGHQPNNTNMMSNDDMGIYDDARDADGEFDDSYSSLC